MGPLPSYGFSHSNGLGKLLPVMVNLSHRVFIFVALIPVCIGDTELKISPPESRTGWGGGFRLPPTTTTEQNSGTLAAWLSKLGQKNISFSLMFSDIVSREAATVKDTESSLGDVSAQMNSQLLGSISS